MNYSVNLDITPGSMPPVLHMSQYDTGRYYTVNLKDGGGDFTPGLGTTAKVKGFNGKNAFEIDATVSLSTVTFQLTDASTDQFGIFPVTIEMTIGSNTLSPLCMIFDIQRAGYTNEQAASSPEFQDAMEEAAQKYILGMDMTARAALLDLLSHVAYIDQNGQDYYDALEVALRAKLSYIVADYAQDHTVYDTDSLDVLKEGDDLIVTAYYDDGSHVDLADSQYTLSGTLTVGTSTITVSYGGKTTTIEVTVTQHVPAGWLYHFEDTLASSGTEDFNFTGVAAYAAGVGGAGKCYYHHVATEGTASTDPLGIYATGLTDIPDLSGDFTISFWAKSVTATSAHPLIANKYYSDASIIGSLEAAPSNVASGWTVKKEQNTSTLKYRGIRFAYINGSMKQTFHATDNTGIDYNIDLPSGTDLTQWHHYALTRKNGVLRFFFDGAVIYSINYTKTIVFADQVCIGNNWGTTSATKSQLTQNGASDYVDDLYIAESCKWDSAFDPSAITY